MYWRLVTRYVEGSRFPDPRDGPADAPLAVGGDLEPATLLDAYTHGVFPWPSRGSLWWWSPDPRAVLPLDGVHVSRSLAKVLRSGRFTTTADTAFAAVIRACAHRPGEGSWITARMRRAYERLHALGHAHSVEVWSGDALVGGVYGVTIGAAFMGESMFHRATDASKVALVALAAHLRARGFLLLDAQLPTPHLASMGALEWPRERFLERLAEVVTQPATF